MISYIMLSLKASLTFWLHVVSPIWELMELYTLYILPNCMPPLTSLSLYICTLPCVHKCTLNYSDIKIPSYNVICPSFNSFTHSFGHLTNVYRFYSWFFFLLNRRNRHMWNNTPFPSVYIISVMYYFLNAIKIKSVRRNKPRNIIYPLKKQHIGSLLIKKTRCFIPSASLSLVCHCIFNRVLLFQLVWAWIFSFSKVISYLSLDLK